MVQNIDSILQRGERLDLLVDKTDTLAGQAYAFRRGARNVRRQQWWKNMRIMMLTGVVGVVSLSLNLTPTDKGEDDAHGLAYILPPHGPILRIIPGPLPIIDAPERIAPCNSVVSHVYCHLVLATQNISNAFPTRSF